MNDKKTILLAEDEQSIYIVTKDYLEDNGFNVEHVWDAQGLLQEAKKANLMIVDVRIPFKYPESIIGVEGIDTVIQLINREIINQSIPIIFISHLDEFDDICQDKLTQGPFTNHPYRWLQKPFELELLLKYINEMLSRH